jgi:hypothetical protein
MIIEEKNVLNGQKLKPGIYGIVEVISDPYQEEKMTYIKSEYAVRLFIKQNLINKPLWLENIKDDRIISNDYIIDGKYFQGHPSMPLKKETYGRIIELIDYEDKNLNNIEMLIDNSPVSNYQEVINLINKYMDAKPIIKEIINRRIERGPLAQKIKHINNYKCQLCEELGKDYYSFKKRSGEYYVETHHVIPVAEQRIGGLGLSNIITVCANHHRQLHYGNVNYEIQEDKFIFKIDDNYLIINKIRIPENS